MAGGKALSDGVEYVQNYLKANPLPQGLSWQIGGDYEEQQNMFSSMILLALLIVILVYMVMASQFESFMGPFVIMFSIPFAFVGVALGNMAANMAVGMMSAIGIIILLGIVASVTAARSRLRPILMTTLTTVLGMLPMALGRGEGSEMWNGLGTTVAWGLSISTLITLVLIPVLYCGFTEHRAKRKARRNK